MTTTKDLHSLSAAECQQLRPGDRLLFISNHGNLKNIRVTGQPKLWKTRPHHVKVPVKFGLYESAYVEYYGEDSFCEPARLPNGQPLLRGATSC